MNHEALIRFEAVTFRYPEVAAKATGGGTAVAPALRDVTVALPRAAFVVVCGPSGAGKSTLLRCINGLVPHFSGGALRGRIRVGKLDPVAAGPETMCHHVGFVFQDPESQFVMDYVEDELAFALENAGMPVAEMRARVEEVIDYLDLSALRNRRLTALSGGEKQRVAIAAGLAFRPAILVLDEPTSQLDPQSAEEVLAALIRLRDRLGLTVVLAEHRLERVLSFADFLLSLPAPAGPVLFGTPAEVLPEMALLPPVASLGKRLGWTPLPSIVAEATSFAEATTVAAAGSHAGSRRGTEPVSSPAAALEKTTAVDITASAVDVNAAVDITAAVNITAAVDITALTVAYGRRQVLQDVSISLFNGEVAVLMGRNGTGKSTLLKALVGLVDRDSGEVRVGARSTAGLSVAEICREVAYLPQDPSALLFAETVRDELEITLRNHDMLEAIAPGEREALLASLGIDHKARAYPRDLSVGERQRAALAAILVTQPRVILLDEPTRGLDYAAKGRLAALIRRWREEGRAVLLVTHDVELAAEVADRVIVLEGGRIAMAGPPQVVLRAIPRFTPQIARLFPDTDWLTVDDAVAALADRPTPMADGAPRMMDRKERVN